MFKFLALVTVLVAVIVAGPLLIKEIHRLPISSRLAGRIINGTVTTIEDNPHQISLQLKDYGHWCGGSIISKNWVLTAAHCFNEDKENFMVLAGTANQFEGGSLYPISEIIIHEDYGSRSSGIGLNDIALVRVKKPFEFDKTREAVPLFHKNEEIESGSIGTVTGWGDTGHGYPDILNRVEVPLMTKEKCDELYEDIGGLGKGQICAGYEEGGKDACQGDSGGPLTINKRLAGIVSWGLGCAISGQPGVYTEVAYFRDWITKYSNV